MTQDPYQPPYDFGASDAQGASVGQSKLGIASFVIAIIGGVGIFGLVFAAGFIEATTQGGIDDQSPVALAIGLGIFGGAALNFLGFAFGMAALFQANRSKVFGIIGLILNALLILGVGGLLVLGMSV